MTEKVERGIIRLVLDCLKPHKPLLPDLALKISELPGVSGVNISLIEIDAKTESIKITIEGTNLNYELIRDTLKKYGTVIHSIDQVVAGSVIVEEVTIKAEEE